MSVSAATTSMRMTMTAMIEGIDANQVDQQPQHGDNKETLVLHLWWLYQAFNTLREYKEGNEEQKQTVHKARQDLSSHIAIRELIVGLPFRDN